MLSNTFLQGRRKIFQGVRLSPCAPSNGPGFFTHNTNQGRENLFNGRVICRKLKTPESRKKTVCSVNTNTVKECKFYIKMMYSDCQY